MWVRAALSLRVKRVCAAAEVPELDASRRYLAGGTLALMHFVYPVLYILRCRILSKVTFSNPANSNPVIVCCPLNHWLPTSWIVVSHKSPYVHHHFGPSIRETPVEDEIPFPIIGKGFQS